MTNHLLRNRGNWQFEDVTEATGTGGGNRSSFTAAWLDANNDGWPDLYVPNEFGDGILLVNQEGKRFVGQPLVDRPSDFGTMGVAVGDVDNDDRIDIYAANMYSKAGSRVIGNLRPGTYPEDVMAIMRTYPTGSQLHRNLGGLKFEKKATEWQIADVGWAYGPGIRRPRQRRLARHLRHVRIHQPGSLQARRVKLRVAGCRVTAFRPQFSMSLPPARSIRSLASSGSIIPGISCRAGTISAPMSGNASSSTWRAAISLILAI